MNMDHVTEDTPTILEGNPLPVLKVKDWVGEVQSFDELQGKILIIDFWATWCHPCLALIPKHNELMKRYHDQGVVVVGICATTGSELMETVARERGIHYPVVKDVDKACERALGVRWFPCHFVVDRDGIIREAAANSERMQKAIDSLLQV